MRPEVLPWRHCARLIAVCVVLAALLLGPGGAAAQPHNAAPAALSSLTDGYEFLYQMMDKYTSGSGLRLVQSFEGGVSDARVSPTP